MQLKHNETAVVLVEFQKQWTEKGLFHRLIKEQLESRHTVENTQRFVANARAHGLKIIHAALTVDPNNKKGWLAYVTFGNFFTKDSWQSELVPGLFEEGDLIAFREYYNFRAFDAFFKSSLERILLDNKIRNVLICGFATDQCPVKTLVTAVKLNFDPYLISDCTATFNRASQERAERKHSDRVVTSQEALGMIGG